MLLVATPKSALFCQTDIIPLPWHLQRRSSE